MYTLLEPIMTMIVKVICNNIAMASLGISIVSWVVWWPGEGVGHWRRTWKLCSSVIDHLIFIYSSPNHNLMCINFYLSLDINKNDCGQQEEHPQGVCPLRRVRQWPKSHVWWQCWDNRGGKIVTNWIILYLLNQGLYSSRFSGHCP
jgi:hypothetical protein